MKLYVKCTDDVVIEWEDKEEGLLTSETVNRLVPLFYQLAGDPWDYVESDDDYYDDEYDGEDKYDDKDSSSLSEDDLGMLQALADENYLDYVDTLWVVKPQYKSDVEFTCCFKLNDGDFVASVDIGDYEPDLHRNLVEMYNKFVVKW